MWLKASVHQRVRHEWLWWDHEAIQNIAERLIHEGIRSVQTQEYVWGMVQEILENEKNLRKKPRFMVFESSKILAKTISAMRAVFQDKDKLRGEIMHRYLVDIFFDINKALNEKWYKLEYDKARLKSSSYVKLRSVDAEKGKKLKSTNTTKGK